MTAQSSAVKEPASANISKIEEKILDTIFKLSEVRERANYVEKQTKGKRRLTAVIYESASQDVSYYWVKVWEDNGINYVTHFNFYVYPETFEIKYYDAVTDKAISLPEWRRELKAER